MIEQTQFICIYIKNKYLEYELLIFSKSEKNEAKKDKTIPNSKIYSIT